MDRDDQHSVFFVEGMCCADEQNVIEKKLRSLKGVNEFTFNLVAQKLYVTHSAPGETITAALKKAGFSAKIFANHRDSSTSFIQRHRNAIGALIAGMLVLSGMCLSASGIGRMSVLPLYGIAILLAGWRVAVRGWKSLKSFSLDMNVLMSVAVVGSVAIGKWEEGASVIVLFGVAGFLEEMSMRRTRKAIASLIDSAPAVAIVRRHLTQIEVPIEDVRLGDIVIIRPGERIPVDGEVVTGSSFVNQSAITGESIPVERNPGSPVFAGTINGRGSLEVRTRKVGEDTTLAHIVHLVEDAQAQRSPTQEYVDRFAKRYTPTVFGIALVVALFPPLFFAAPFGTWLYRGLVLLVIACPCALVISTPVTIISGLTAAARRGVLIKGGRCLEEAGRLKAVLFDKTGTLTLGSPSVTDIIQLNSVSAREILRIAALGEMKSEHALGRAVIAKAREEKVDLTGTIGHFESVTGRGILITVDEKPYAIGNHQFVEERGLCSPSVELTLRTLESEGKTAIVVSTEEEALGILGVSDVVRSEGRLVIEELQAEGVQEIMLISGDSTAAVRSTASALGIRNFVGELLPADKVAIVKKMKLQYGNVAMVGDGVNDAPALAASSLGIAMGTSGTDVAIEAADVVLMKDDLSKISSMISIGKKTMSILRQNIALALLTKALFLFLALLGFASLWMAVIADDGVTLLVIMNSLRLLRKS